jgi:hypothetical protein
MTKNANTAQGLEGKGRMVRERICIGRKGGVGGGLKDVEHTYGREQNGHPEEGSHGLQEGSVEMEMGGTALPNE